MESLTSPDFWDAQYEGRLYRPFDPNDWREYVSIQLVRSLEKLDLDGKRVLEIGGGDAKILCYLAKQHPHSRFVVLDYSEIGCQLARERALRERVKVEVVCSDMFNPPKSLTQAFDVVFSVGVVEHYKDLVGAIHAKKAFLRIGGVVFTVIPNLVSPIYAYLTRRWSVRVWKAYVPYDLYSLLKAHREADLEIIGKGYLGSMEFGMLSMAAHDIRRVWREWALYLWLTRLSKAVHWFEFHFFDLPASRLLSPFMHVLARRRE